uniref:UPF0329 protein ECU05_1680/ECU11_0050-like n=1 Tax=Nicotiana tabacum TaxID=4097 RepID=A0A1S4B4X4_TOBAC|nr:PREDICTED: UPF0329 protein ECU05_1680/ECU11_0050-like [Nicotiana tabacum]
MRERREEKKLIDTKKRTEMRERREEKKLIDTKKRTEMRERREENKRFAGELLEKSKKKRREQIEENIVRVFEPRAGLGNRVIDEVAEAEVKYNKLRKRVRESEAEHMALHKANMEMINEWKERAVKSSERLEYLEYNNTETSDGWSTPTPNDLVLRLEQKILELQGELKQVRNLANPSP